MTTPTWIFRVAAKALLVNKSRSLLTTLGVIIGVWSVVTLTAIGNGLSAYVTQQFDQLGSNNIVIAPGEIFNESGGFSQESQANALVNNKLKLSDATAIRNLREQIELVVPLNRQGDSISYSSQGESTTVIGTTFEYPRVSNLKIAKGRFFSKTDDASSERVAVLGWTIANDVFGKVDPIGKRVKIGQQTFEVIGLAEEVGGSFGGPSFDSYIYIPLKTSFKLYDKEVIVQIIAKARERDGVATTITAIEKELGKRLDDDEYSVFDQRQILNTINQILSVLTTGLGGIAAISLVVGGIGIMNIMLVSVTERTREIGLRKALGATPSIILWQFLIEAALLSLFGGGMGLALAYLSTLALSQFLPAVITMQAVIMAFGTSTVVGLIFGAAPARRAASLSPIEALRYE